MRKSTAQGYTESLSRIREIVEILESDQADIDLLETLTKEAVDLITHCRKRLNGVQTAVTQALRGLNMEDVDPTSAANDVPHAE